MGESTAMFGGAGVARRLLGAAVAVSALFASGVLPAQDVPPLELVARQTPTSIILSAVPREGPDAVSQRQEVEDALRRGLQSQIVLQFRLYERTTGFARLLGDRLERETVLTRVLRHEPIAGRYVMEESVDGGVLGVAEANTPADLLSVFFAVRELEIPVDRTAARSLYLRARYQLSPIRISQQLALVALFADLGVRTSAWSVAEELGP